MHEAAIVVDPIALWHWMPIGYAVTLAIETPVLLIGLRRSLPSGWMRVAAACWLTGVTYPIVVIVLPLLLWPIATYGTYLAVAESFAIVTECVLYKLIWRGSRRDVVVVALANVLSAAVAWVLFVAS